MGLVDEGGGHVHVIRNEGSVEARTVAVQLIPAGATACPGSQFLGVSIGDGG